MKSEQKFGWDGLFETTETIVIYNKKCSRWYIIASGKYEYSILPIY